MKHIKNFSEDPIEILSLSEIDNLKKKYAQKQQYVKFNCEICGKKVIRTLYRTSQLKCQHCIASAHAKQLGEINKTRRISEEEKIRRKQKREQTCLEKYGVKSYMESQEFRKKSLDSILDKYGTWENYVKHHTSQVEKTCLKKYGVTNGGASKQAIDKIKQTQKEKYGCYYVQTEEFLEKSRQTCNEHYGVDSYSQTEESKEKQRNLDRSGYIKKTSYIYNDILFDSSWELIYYLWLKDNNIDFRYHESNDRIAYKKQDGSIHYYHPDFIVNDEIIEIKGAHLIKDGVLWDPYHNVPDIDKTKCLQENNVKILTKKDLKEQFLYFRRKYGDHFLMNHRAKKE